MPKNERSGALISVKGVSSVFWDMDDSDNTCLDGIMKLHERHITDTVFFGNGGDRNAFSTPEVEYCMRNGIGLIFNLGGGKTQSSSELVERARAVD